MPNQAMPWASLVKIFAVMSAIVMLIAVIFALIGYVLVLPFAGLDILLLGYALYKSAKYGEQKQVVTVDTETVKVELGTKKPEKVLEIPRYWANVELQKPKEHWLPAKLLIRSHGKEVELGQFLNEEERKGLAKLLKKELQG